MNSDGFNPRRGTHALVVRAASLEEVEYAYEDAVHRNERPTYEARANGEQATGFNSPTGQFVIVVYDPTNAHKLPAFNIEQE